MVNGARGGACAALLVQLVVAGCGDPAEQAREAGAGPAAAGAATGPMSRPRAGFPAVSLPDGRVLVVGGSSADLPYGGHVAELYDPSTGTFQQTGALHVGRKGHAAALLPDGRVLVTGGVPDGGGTSITDEVWDPATGAWTIVGYDVPREAPAVAALADGTVLVAGGGDSTASHASARVFHPSSQSFSAVGTMVTPRSSATATLLDDGRVLIAGGSGECAPGVGCAVLAGAELFDPGAGTFSAAHAMNEPRVGHTATRISDGRVLVAGGVGERSTELYDPAADQWDPSASLSVVRSAHGAALLADGSILFLGGQNASGQLLDGVERWSMGHGMSGADPLASGRRSFGLAALQDGALLLAGGVDAGGYTNTAALYSYSCAPTAVCGAGWCGPHPDGCGGSMECGGCGEGATCASGLCCVPQTCASTGIACGQAMDGCGGILDCACADGGVCSPQNTCCAPATCASLGRDCGTASDGCGGSLSCGTCGTGQACSSSGVCQAIPGAAAYDATLKAPRCLVPGPCDSGSLLTGRAGLGPEAHAPNTLGPGCADATAGTFHATESLDRLRITALDGGTLSAGKLAWLEATVWAAGGPYDRLDLYVTADAQASAPVWTWITTLTPSVYSEQKLSTTFTVPAGGSDVKAVRGVFRWSGTAGACPGGYYTDVDDLVFSAAVPPDLAPPSIAVTAPSAGAVLTGAATVSVAVADDVGVTGVSCSDGATIVGSSSAPPFSVSWNTRSSENGVHDLTCTALDASGKAGSSAPVSVTTRNDRTAPAIRFAAPASGAAVAGYVAVKVEAADDVGVVRVDYTLDGAALSWSTGAPFGISWNANGVPNGPHTLTAVARDAAGNTGSASVPVVVDHETTPPTVNLTAPVEGAVLTGTVTLSAAASDDVAVTRVSFYDGSTLLGSATAPPYQYTWSTRAATNGAHVLSARAFDACNNVGDSGPIHATIENDVTPPTVAVTAPRSGVVVSGAVTLTASASDAVGNWNPVCTVTAPPWTCTWDTTAVSNGSHIIVARAFDAVLQWGESAVTVTVSNAVVTPPSSATWDATLRAPRCGAGASCDSGTLLVGRGPLGPEANAPNTLQGSCADGSSGTFHGDESLDRLEVSTVDGGPLAAGKTVRVEATVWAYASYTSDKLDLYYTANASSPTWTFLGTLAPTGSGAQTLSKTYTLPAGTLQAVRGTFRYAGYAGSCTTGGYDDHDDLVFAVQ